LIRGMSPFNDQLDIHIGCSSSDHVGSIKQDVPGLPVDCA
jgi:hypothetical protein